MALQKEIWLNDIIEGLFPNNTFAVRSIDHSDYVNDKTVHVPNAGALPTVVKNRSTVPATITQRTDVDITYDINEFTSDPVYIPNKDTVELSYDKRQSIIGGSKVALSNAVVSDLILSWIPTAPTFIVGTSGQRVTMVNNCKTKFDNDDVPQEGRCMLLTPTQYNQLLNELTNAQVASFLSGADPVKGIVGKYLTFDFYMRSVTAYTNGTTVVPPTSTNTSNAGLAWHEKSVARASSGETMFGNEDDPTYYGDIYSFLVRAGGQLIRSDKKGFIVING
ncbi:MAG: hypothetical protein LBT56_02880 [Prevotellaceae bacterium]|jgi:hypothetical protein|nr:hypothetical protein [Prevotellaceae bacterium]